MIRSRHLSSALLSSVLGSSVLRATAVAAVLVPLTLASSVAYADTVRPEVGKPLQAAAEFMKSRKYAEAMAKVREADAVSNKTPAESSTIERMRGAIAAASGDSATAAKSYEATIASGKLAPAEQQKMILAVAGMYYQAKDYSKSASWYSRYIKEGGTDPSARTLLLQTYYLSNDCASVSRELAPQIQADESAGRAPSEESMQLLANCYAKQKDNNGYAVAMEKLLTYYPKKDYWTDVLNRLQRKPSFSNRLSLDLDRLKLLTGNLTTSGDFMEMAQLAMQDEQTAEGKKIVDQGYSAGVLGKGADVDRQKRLADLAAKRALDGKAELVQKEADAQADKDGTSLITVGMNYVGYGQFDKGIPLMEQGLRKGGFKRPEDAKLHLGIAYVMAGQRNKAVQMFKTVGGTDGTADLARLWTIYAKHPG